MIIVTLALAAFAGDIPAFLGAEGFGRFAKGGRGGDVYQVTTLSDSGPGSLREGIRSATGPRTIVFTVSGTIELKSRLTVEKSNITLADWKSENVHLQSADTPRTQTAAEALGLVLARAGASLHRDAVDLRVIDNVQNRKGKVIDSQKEVGGWPALKNSPAPVDSDHDGMPDEWEKERRLNPNDPLDRNTRNADGYTRLEEYLNSLCAQ